MSRAGAILCCLVAAVCLSAVSCDDSSTYIYHDTVMGDVVDGRFITDGGLVYHFTEQTCSGEIDTLSRALVDCDILQKTGPGEYDVRLTGFRRVLRKRMVLASETPDTLGHDAIKARNVWVKGGYINVCFEISVLSGSSHTHYINMVMDDIRPGSDTLWLELRHNAGGETWENENLSIDSLVLATGYASFPLSGSDSRDISKFLGHDSVNIALTWDWMDVVDGGYTRYTVRDTIASSIPVKDIVK